MLTSENALRILLAVAFTTTLKMKLWVYSSHFNSSHFQMVFLGDTLRLVLYLGRPHHP